jgi:hypothetical protein
MADAHNGRHYDPEILALIEHAEAAILRSQQVIARMDKLARALANAVQRSDRRFATQDIRARHSWRASVRAGLSRCLSTVLEYLRTFAFRARNGDADAFTCRELTVADHARVD